MSAAAVMTAVVALAYLLAWLLGAFLLALALGRLLEASDAQTERAHRAEADRALAAARRNLDRATIRATARWN